MLTSPIMIVEDDDDDCKLIADALLELGIRNELKCFVNGVDALSYLKSTDEKTFLILSDVNMPLMNGLELKKKINEDEELKRKSIPFVFLSTSSSPNEIKKAYEMMVQGFFQKSSNFDALKFSLKTMIEYWQISRHPNSVV